MYLSGSLRVTVQFILVSCGNVAAKSKNLLHFFPKVFREFSRVNLCTHKSLLMILVKVPKTFSLNKFILTMPILILLTLPK